MHLARGSFLLLAAVCIFISTCNASKKDKISRKGAEKVLFERGAKKEKLGSKASGRPKAGKHHGSFNPHIRSKTYITGMKGKPRSYPQAYPVQAKAPTEDAAEKRQLTDGYISGQDATRKLAQVVARIRSDPDHLMIHQKRGPPTHVMMPKGLKAKRGAEAVVFKEPRRPPTHVVPNNRRHLHGNRYGSYGGGHGYYRGHGGALRAPIHHAIYHAAPYVRSAAFNRYHGTAPYGHPHHGHVGYRYLKEQAPDPLAAQGCTPPKGRRLGSAAGCPSKGRKLHSTTHSPSQYSRYPRNPYRPYNPYYRPYDPYHHHHLDEPHHHHYDPYYGDTIYFEDGHHHHVGH